MGLAHATSFLGSDTLNTIEAARYYYDVPEDEVCIASVNASEHSVSTTKIFTVGEQQMISDWLKVFPEGILSVVSDTFDLWKLITEYLPNIKEEIMSRDGKLVIRPDSGDPVDIICGFDRPDTLYRNPIDARHYHASENEQKGVIELLWDIFGGTVNSQGYKVLDPHIGAIYGDSINLERQEEIYSRLEKKGFAATNIVLGVGSYQYIGSITRDSVSFAAKGSWFQVKQQDGTSQFYDIYKDPITDDGTKRSLKGLLMVDENLQVHQKCTPEEEKKGLLRLIYDNGVFYNQTTLNEIRNGLAENRKSYLS